jgi:hypothetical protein
MTEQMTKMTPPVGNAMRVAIANPATRALPIASLHSGAPIQTVAGQAAEISNLALGSSCRERTPTVSGKSQGPDR